MRHPRACRIYDASHAPGGRRVASRDEVPAWSGRCERREPVMPRGALLGAGRIPHDAPEPMRVVRPVTPGPPWRNPGHAFLGAPPLAFGGKAKERKTGAPPAPKQSKQGPMMLGLFSFRTMRTAGALDGARRTYGEAKRSDEWRIRDASA